jgi:hypothetical protein
VNSPSPVRANADALAGVLLLGITAIAFWGARGAGPSVWLFPRLAAGVAGVCGAALLVGGLRRRDVVVLWEGPREVRDVALFVAGVTLYAALLRWLGFWLLSGLLVGVAAYALGHRGTWRLAAWLVGGLALSLAMDALFVGLFGVPLPGGLLWDGAGWRPWVP